MKKIILTVVLAVFGLGKSQNAFKGKADVKAQVGANIQSGGSGIVVSSDFGLGESMSAGVQMGFLLGTKQVGDTEAKFGDQFDIRARFQANLGQVLGLPAQADIYPGLSLGLKNFGGHFGARYFFGKGFGMYSEVAFPITKYNKEADNYKLLNNQFQFHIGASFDL